MAKDLVLPKGWREDFLGKADLEASYRALGGATHFFAEGMRGRIRSLQLRVEEAQRHFKRAIAMAQREPETIENLIRQFLVQIYTFNNILIAGPIDPEAAAKAEEPWIPLFPDEVLEAYPELRIALRMRKFAEGMYRIHIGKYEEAVVVLEELLEEGEEPVDDFLSSSYLALAAAYFNLGLEDDARRHIENASLSVQAGGWLLNRARVAGVLYGFYSYLEEDDEADGWELFLDRLGCPAETKEICLDTGLLIVKRSLDQNALVLF